MEDSALAEEEPLPPWAICRTISSEIPSLQTLICRLLAKHLHHVESLDVLPDHLLSIVRESIQQDRRLLSDDGLGVWLSAVSRGGTATNLNLRWCSSLSDEGMQVLGIKEPSWAARLLDLDLAFCELISDAGLQLLAPACPALRAIALTGCTRCGDGACKSLGHHTPCLERCELDLLQRITDVGVQAIVRGCRHLGDLRLGGCSRLSSISTSLISDHLRPHMRRLGLGGISNLNDVDLEDVGKLTSLTWLDLCACPKVSDAGIKQIGLLAARQCKLVAEWKAAHCGRSGSGEDDKLGGLDGTAGLCPPALTHLDLGGLTRLSDTGLLKLLSRTRHLASLDLRGCSRLTENGLTTALANCDVTGAHVAGMLNAPSLSTLTLLSCEAATEQAVSFIITARPGLKTIR